MYKRWHEELMSDSTNYKYNLVLIVLQSEELNISQDVVCLPNPADSDGRREGEYPGSIQFHNSFTENRRWKPMQLDSQSDLHTMNWLLLPAVDLLGQPTAEQHKATLSSMTDAEHVAIKIYVSKLNEIKFFNSLMLAVLQALPAYLNKINIYFVMQQKVLLDSSSI